MKHRILYILALLLLVPSLAQAQSLMFTSYPSHTRENNKWIIRDVNPGENYQELLTLENLSDQEIQLHTSVLETSGSTEKIKLLENQPFRNIGKWITTEKNTFTLTPFEKKEIKININIPKDTALGKYQAAVMVSGTNKTGTSLNLSTRIGNRIYLNVTDSSVLQTNTFSLQISIWQILLITISSLGLLYSLMPKKLIKIRQNHDR
jgi:uncharacterized membrane protein